MPSIPLTAEEEKHVLSILGIQSTEDLFSSVPPKLRELADFKLDLGSQDDGSGNGLSEHALRETFQSFASNNWQGRHFLGGGIYDNVIPSIVNQLVLRGEFLTCYTPYQPEISQGTLQAIFEFQTMISRIMELPISNASMYDGATATAEGILMAQRLSDKTHQEVLVAGNLPPEYLEITRTFLKGHTTVPTEIPWNEQGCLDKIALQKQLTEKNPCAVVVGYPNYFGILESLPEIKAMLPKKCLLIVSSPDPSAFSIFQTPGKGGADIAVGEAHQLGTPMLFGGPHVGYFSTKKEYLRQMPGRLCGESVDARGQRAYTLTLSTREQHIRREKATSNICTNQGLIALRTTIYLSFLGKVGFERLGQTNYSLFQYLKSELELRGIKLAFPQSLHYREGAFLIPNLEIRFQNAVKKRLLPGIRLSRKGFNGPLGQALLIAVHPKNTKRDIDELVEVLSHD